MKKAEQLQFLRFVAFGFVFMRHANEWVQDIYPTAYAGISSIVFFFLLSGLVAGYGAWAKEIELSFHSVGQHMWKRIKQIYPLYIVTTLLMVSYSVIPTVIEFGDWSGLKTEGTHMLRCVFLVQSWFPEGYFSFNGVAWFLSTLVFLDLLQIPLLCGIKKLAAKKELWILLLGVASLIGTVVYSYLVRNTNVEFWGYIFPPARIGEYLAGMCMGYLVRSRLEKGAYTTDGNINGQNATIEINDADGINVTNGIKTQNSSTNIGYTILEIMVILFWIANIYIEMPTWTYRIVRWLLPNVLLLWVFALGKGWISDLFRWKPLKYLGDISFACYLLHVPLMYSYSNLVEPQEFFTWRGRLFSIGFCLLITVMMAMLVSKRKKESNGK